MLEHSLFTSFFLIFTGAAVLASVALFTRQPLLVAYIVLGALLGPYGLELVSDTNLLSDIAHIGIIFLLFLLGLDMQPAHLIHMLKKATLVAIASSALFLGLGFSVGSLFGFSQAESVIIGAAVMFSSTIIGIKLLPTTVLHHKHTGELVVGLLLLQDVIAIIVLLILNSGGDSDPMSSFVKSAIALPALGIFAWAGVRYVILPLLMKFDRFHEYIFLVAIGWCLGMAEAAKLGGLSAEMGAFIAGIALATSPISQYIATNLKPLRDFFLILFFFSVGASFNLNLIGLIIVPALILTIAVLLLKPVIFRLLLGRISESPSIGWEIGFRLGQISEFSLLIAYLAFAGGLIGTEASHVIQATAILSFLLSTYIVIFNYPSPIAVKDSLRKD
ncbi:Inner membrane protein YbaL [Marinobacterium sp. xm-a-121]|jgi:Kef-type K+ transport system membrane component KefB|uniref:cation:proton antiporter n=1 Tax=unclassified Marinobacterium TaxID=2644139 RepID=UPI001569BA91|nr:MULTISPECIES: cation:proton antiporter [unclassified Marinobacterium]NRP35522.1 Inner membrane protein YbaL [Marinobacterium sp. xm-d-579]NRP37741.1 Inner membrane protein YbaL [Marinobacterium sp. xm-a-121]NRP46178.1 Inner membrane protein YbaL [Marinobacterium sp. xm-d-543]NRP52841.1 Inner membrane protein YbaL [Marinobacterium sp. xm-v-242]NRP58576.1 Inner membrane protein YbaL [Marinobacterium sp. xm-d-564]